MATGARSNFGDPMLEPEVFRKQIYCIEESTCDTVGFFGARGIVPLSGVKPALHFGGGG